MIFWVSFKICYLIYQVKGGFIFKWGMGCPKGVGHQFWWGWVKKIMECLTMPPTIGNPDSCWSFHKLYFISKHTFHKWYRKNRRNDWSWNLQTSAKLSGNVIISKTFLLMISIIIHFLSSKSFVNIYRVGKTKLQRQDN